MSDNYALLQKLRAIDLAILDTVLYLHAYDCDEASSYLAELRDERRELKKAYVEACSPLTKHDDCGKNLWTHAPWPWEMEAN